MLHKLAPTASLLAALAVAGAAFAGNGGGPSKSSSSISEPIVVSASSLPTASTTTTPSYGDVITFDVSTTATASPFVDVKCSQDGVQVGEGWAAFFAGGTAGTFGLYSNAWTGGAADCTADLGMFAANGKWKVLASTAFPVSP